METNGKWRCPYCDGWNRAEDPVCVICGDGRRDGTPKEKKTYTSTARKPENDQNGSASSGSGQASSESKAGTAGSEPEFSWLKYDATAPAAKKKKSHGGLWLFLILLLAAAGFGYWKYGDVLLEKLGIKPKEPGYEVEFTEEAKDWIKFDAIYDYGGEAVITMSSGNPKDNYVIYTCPAGADLDSMSNPYHYEESGQVRLPSNGYYTDDISSEINMTVVPDDWTYFIIHAYNDGESGYWWKSLLYKFGERDADLPLQVTKFDICEWKNAGERYAWYCEQYEYEHEQEAKEPVAALLTSAQELNRRLDDGAVFGYDLNVSLKSDASYLDAWLDENELNRYLHVAVHLTGPGNLDLMDTYWLQYKDGGYPDQYITSDVFSVNYSSMKPMGGYQRGEYLLEFYIAGIKAYEMNFTLS